MGGYLHASGRARRRRPAACPAPPSPTAPPAACTRRSRSSRRCCGAGRSGCGEYLDVVGRRRRALADGARDRRAPRDRRGAGSRPRHPHRPLRLLRRLRRARREVARGRRDRGRLLREPVPRARPRALDRAASTTTPRRAASARDLAARLRDARPRRVGARARARRHLRRARARDPGGGRASRTSRRAARFVEAEHPQHGRFRQLGPVLAGTPAAAGRARCASPRQRRRDAAPRGRLRGAESDPLRSEGGA